MGAMQIILLSGGSGRRLWPLSNEIRSKQFIRIFRDESGRPESMLQRVYRQIKSSDPEARVTVSTARPQMSEIRHQLGTGADAAIEPCRRGTFPAVALAVAYLHDVQGISGEETVTVCPVDPYVDASYFECVKRMDRAAADGKGRLILMGIQPKEPSDAYGYITPADTAGRAGWMFTEKPPRERAAALMSKGALWNGGVFSFRLKYMLEQADHLLGASGYEALLSGYAELPYASVDQAVAERERDLYVVPYHGAWKDVGTWNAMTEVMDGPVAGNGRLDASCENVHIVNELEMPVIGIGLQDTVIAASPEGILVSTKDQSSRVKALAETLDRPVMFAEKSWGSYRVLDQEDGSLTVKITLLAGRQFRYHSHRHRDETWTVLSGRGEAVLDGQTVPLTPGSVVNAKAGVRHTLRAKTEMTLIEVQTGSLIDVHDKIKYE